MGASIDRVDRICERVDRFSISVRKLDGGLDANAVLVLLDMDHRVKRFPVAIEISHERGNAAFKIESHLAVGALVHELDGHAACNKCHLAEALDESVEPVIDVLFEILG